MKQLRAINNFYRQASAFSQFVVLFVGILFGPIVASQIGIETSSGDVGGALAVGGVTALCILGAGVLGYVLARQRSAG